jgi:peptidase S46-like protein
MRPSHRFASLLLFSSLALLLACHHLLADEGMWLFNAVPAERLQQQHQFTPSAAWLEHLQKSSARFDNGASGSFVSPDGLVLTNQHVGADALQKFSDADHNYLRDGFYARTRSEEKRCFDLELNVLMSSEDVTARVNAAVQPEMTPEQANLARRKVVAEIEKESQEKTGLRSDVVTLYEGGSYQLYRFKQYTDVRLVFAPEAQIAYYGGDPDNFEYPRYALDICLFRVYENGQPAHITNYLKVSKDGPAEYELIFVSGHPGSTNRGKTVSEFTDERDRVLPRRLEVLYRREVLLGAYAARSPENARRSRDYFLEIQNSRKLCDGLLAGLLDPQLFGELVNRENTLRSAFRNDPRFQPALSAYDRLERSQAVIAQNAKHYDLFEGSHFGPIGFDSKLFRIARTLVRAAAERPKPNGERLPEFQETNRTTLELQLFSEAPIYDDLEKLTLADSLTYLIGQLGPSDPLVQTALAGKSPHDRANELVSGTNLSQVAIRRQLYASGAAAIQDCSDPMIGLARAIDGAARAARKINEEQTEIQRQAYAQIAAARLAIEGNKDYPDATFTLRLAYGTVDGYEEDGRAVPAFTHFAGLYRRAAEHEARPPFDLPARWVEQRDRLDPETPFNFVSTADIVGGNSGSPVVNRAGEFVGIIFDGNIESLVLDCDYTSRQARAVSVDSRAILEALTKVYKADALVEELMGSHGGN